MNLPMILLDTNIISEAMRVEPSKAAKIALAGSDGADSCVDLRLESTLV